MIRYTTPKIEIEVESSIPLSEYAERHVTFSQLGNVIDVVPEVDGNVLTVELTQLESAVFDYAYVLSVQVNVVTADGKRYASEIMPMNVSENLLKKVLP